MAASADLDNPFRQLQPLPEKILVDQEMCMDSTSYPDSFGVPKFDLNKVECDRFIPLRTNDVSAGSRLSIKQEIEHCPPVNWNLDPSNENSQPA